MALKTYTPTQEELASFAYASIQTDKGTIVLELFPQDAPQNVCNFATLAQEGFYNGLTFHRVIPNFVAQGGCPIGNGCGGPGYNIKCETQDNPHKHIKGTLSMAHAGKDTGGSQFFICFAPQPHLDGVHTIFGQIQDEESLKVLNQIKQDDTIIEICIHSSNPNA
ncbi:peptidylprolyl isomerase [Helicobacter enhydrae]|uniref:Peptidyl-prolyl cis-trans isomerase n=1 Tax=Helicobacter enhydrae TaxID=222136 RepID=A0A1B1U468_9HELI|nr:peptidylprolyl isomerase [Helicobacter enhydrae]ANV97548.1 peptidylprolyl isomerase [Helicobacter enhydrae]